MCGHVGVMGNLFAGDLKIFKQLLYVDVLRGSHSTGVAAVGSKKGVRSYKRALAASDFLHLPAADKIISTEADCLIGHNRYATAGSIEDATAHPFNYNHVVLAHNGTLTNKNSLPNGNMFSVDSEAIAYNINENESPISTLEALAGSYALVWYDRRDSTLNFARNDEREFHMALAGGVLYWASEKLMLEWILDRNKVSVTDIKELPVGMHVKVAVGNKKLTWDDFLFEEFEVKKYTYTSYGTGYGGYYGSKKASGGGTVTNTSDHLDKKLYEMGLYKGQEVGLVATSFLPYTANSKQGILQGYMETDPSVLLAMHNTDVEDIIKNSDGSICDDIVYVSTVAGVGYHRDSNNAVTGACAFMQAKGHTIDARSDFVEEPVTEKKSEAERIVPNDDGSVSLSGITFSPSEIKQVMKEGCAWCGSPFTMEDMGKMVVDDDCNVFHEHLCWDEYKKQCDGVATTH